MRRTWALLTATLAFAACGPEPDLSKGRPSHEHVESKAAGPNESLNKRWYRNTTAALARRAKSVVAYDKLHPSWSKSGSTFVQSQHYQADFSARTLRLATDAWDVSMRVLGEQAEGEQADGEPADGSTTVPPREGWRISSVGDGELSYGASSHGIVQRYRWLSKPADNDNQVHAESDTNADQLVVSFAVEGLEPVLVNEGPGDDAKVALRKDQKVKLWYRGVYAADHNGRPLRAWLSVSSQTIHVHVDAHHATFPVTVDPLIATDTQTVRLAVSEEDHRFGRDVMLRGSRMVVFCAYHLHHYQRQADGSWLLVETLPAPNTVPSAIDDSGERFSYRSTGTVSIWEPDIATGNLVSHTVTVSSGSFPHLLSGDRMLLYPLSFTDDSPYLLYERQANASWAHVADIPNQANRPQKFSWPHVVFRPSTVTLDNNYQIASTSSLLLGPAVREENIAIVSNRMIVGDVTGGNAGAGFVYQLQPNGEWAHIQTLSGPNQHSEAFFGASVAARDGLLVVRAFQTFAWGGAFAYQWDAASDRYVLGATLVPLDGIDEKIANVHTGDLGLAAVNHPRNSAVAPFAGAVHLYQLQADNGDRCTEPEQCGSGLCVDGFCCASACSGTCESCGVPGSEGTCQPAEAGTDPRSECGSDACNGLGACGSLTGATCATSTDCVSGFCRSGVCCNERCDGPCDTCTATPGTCEPNATGSVVLECGAYRCDGESSLCPDRCDNDANCSPAARCNELGLCEPLAGLGDACGADGECADGHCADGLCCNEACDSPCATCTGGVCNDNPCGDYRCQNDACLTECVSTADCALGRQCDASGSCIVPEPSSPQTVDGCSLHPATRGKPTQRSNAPWLIALMAAGAAFRRQRKGGVR